MNSNVKLVVVYHSGYGHTKVVAEHVAKGAAEHVDAKVMSVEELDWDALDAADAIVFGAPTYMGSASAPFKAFMDETSKRWFTSAWKDKVAAGFTNSGSWSGDKLATLQQFMLLAMQHQMVWVGQDQMPGNNSSKGTPEDVNRVGSFSGLMTQANTDAGPDTAPPEADRKTAELFGARVAAATIRWKNGA